MQVKAAQTQKNASASKQDVDKINEHMSTIDSKVHKLQKEVKNLQTDLSESQKNVQQIQVENQDSLVDGNDEKSKQKINRFAQMLRKLNNYKTQYKTATTA